MDPNIPNKHVTFEGENPLVVHHAKPPTMATWLIKHSSGLVRSESQATYVLVVLIVVINIIALTLIFGIPDVNTIAPQNTDSTRAPGDT